MELASAGLIKRTVEEEMRESYLRYSMSVIIARALPDARDGLKPSQRRILYAMRQLNLGPASKHRKCAKISGDTSGDFHPHGEQIVYPTLARLAQDWVMRYPLVQGQGNFGSIDGDPPAAMRYTEARMTSASVALMEDLEKETVDHVPNYDDTKTEPTVFPARFPNLLANGSSGIAVGMATNIPSHNLLELVAATKLVLERSDVSIEEILEVMPGPDFATGGVIMGRSGIAQAYRTGRGKIVIRARWHAEELDHDRSRIVVTEVPYNVNKARLIESIASLINDKQITGISDIRDESDKDGLRFVIDLKRGESADVIANQLYKFTDMQITFGCNMLALDKGLPRLMNIRQMISCWVEHRIEVVRRRIAFELKKALARAHILEGYLLALDHLDEVIALIRSSASREVAKKELMQRYEMSDRQAHAVLDLRLYQLTNMEHEKVVEEHRELLERIANYRAILASDEKVRAIISEELTALTLSHKSLRRSKIEEGEINVEDEDLIPNIPVIVTLSEDDYLKRMDINTFREQRRGGMGVSGMQMRKEEDRVKTLTSANMHNWLLFVTNLGRLYWIKVWQIPEASRKSKGRPLVNLLPALEENERVAVTLRVEGFREGIDLALCSRAGVIKKTPLIAFSRPRRKGVQAIVIDEGDEIVDARLVHEEDQIMLFTHQGMAVRFETDQVRQMGRVARGVRGVRLKGENDYTVAMESVKENDTLLVICENGYGKRSMVNEFRQTSRGGVGVRSIITSERNGGVVAAMRVTDDDGLLMISEQGQVVRIPIEQIRVMGRSTQGVRLANFKKDTVRAARRLENMKAYADAEDEEESSIDSDDQSEAESQDVTPEDAVPVDATAQSKESLSPEREGDIEPEEGEKEEPSGGVES